VWVNPDICTGAAFWIWLGEWKLYAIIFPDAKGPCQLLTACAGILLHIWNRDCQGRGTQFLPLAGAESTHGTSNAVCPAIGRRKGSNFSWNQDTKQMQRLPAQRTLALELRAGGPCAN